MYRPWRADWERGGDIDARSDSGETPLMKAVMTGNPERVGQVLVMGLTWTSGIATGERLLKLLSTGA